MERTYLIYRPGTRITKLVRPVAILVALAAGICIVYAFEPATAGFYPQCVFHMLTGLYCPGCGTARGLHALLHMDPASAFSYNPLMVVSLPFILYASGKGAYRNLTGSTAPRRLLPAWVIWAIFVVIMAYWILRNLPVYPFTLLAPGGLQ